MGAKFELSGLDDFLRATGRAQAVFRRGMERAMFKSTTRIKQDAVEEAPRGVSDPGLKGALTTKVSWNKGEVGLLAGKAKHGPHVEFGTVPHFPPYKEGTPLYKWVRLKLKATNVKSTAFLIARKISRVGTKAQPFFYPSFEKNINKTFKDFEDALNDIISVLRK